MGPQDASHIEAAFLSLAGVGLVPVMRDEGFLREMAEAIAAQWDGFAFEAEPAPAEWALFALTESDEEGCGAFTNAVFLEEHYCEDADDEKLKIILNEVIEIGRPKWRVERIEPIGAQQAGAGDRVRIALHATPPAAPFELQRGKDFDGSMIFRLNERLPPDVEERYAAFFLYGRTWIVFLKPDQLKKLSELCGHEFIASEDQMRHAEDRGPRQGVA